MREGRTKYNPSVPLIGVTSLSGIAGGLQLRKMLREAKNDDADKTVLEGSPTLNEISERCISLKEDMSYAQWAWELTLQVCGCCFIDTSGGKNPALHELKLPTYVRKDNGNQRKFQQDLSGAWIECSPEQEKDFRGNTKPGKGSEMFYDDLVQMDDEAVSNGKDKPHLDPNHSHFILVDKGDWNARDGFGADRHFRAVFESAVVGADVQKELSKELHGMDVRGGRGNASLSSDSYIKAGVRYFKLTDEAPNPVVLVCLQGGQGSVDTVLKACQAGTAALLVRGSGLAADLLSDAVRLRFTPSHSAHVSWLNLDIKQDAFWRFLELCDVNPREYRNGSVETDLYDWGKAIENIQNAIRNMQNNQVNQRQSKLINNAHELVRTTYQIFASEAKPGSKEDSEECLTMIKKSLEVALTKKGWVFDLHSTEPGTDDFHLELLKCLLNGIAPVGEESSATVLWQKLKLSMIWSCDDVIDYLLERISKRINEEEQQAILDKALLFALKKHKVHALNSLIHRGTGMQMLDVGNGCCYVKCYGEDSKIPVLSEGSIKEHFVKFCHGDVAANRTPNVVVPQQPLLPAPFAVPPIIMHAGVVYVTSSPVQPPLMSTVAKKAAAEKEADFIDRDRKRYFDAASKWTELIEEAKIRTPYFGVMWDKAVVLWDKAVMWDEPEKNLNSASTQEDHEKIMRMYEKDFWQAGHPIPETLRLKVYQCYKRKLDFLKKMKGPLFKHRKSGRWRRSCCCVSRT